MRRDVMVRDMDVSAPHIHECRRAEVVVDGILVRSCAQVAIWSEETRGLFSSLAISRARREFLLMRKRVTHFHC